MIIMTLDDDDDGLYICFEDFTTNGNITSLLFSMDFNGVVPYWRGSECEDIKVEGIDEI